MTPDIIKQGEPSMSTIMLKYELLKRRLNVIRCTDPYVMHRTSGGDALWHVDYIPN